MTWEDARGALRTLVEGAVGSAVPVFYTPPPRLPRRGVSVVMPIPARDVRRRPSEVRRMVVDQAIDVYHWTPSDLKPDQTVTIADTLETVIEALNAALDKSLQLGGEAISVSEPEWEEATGVRYAEVDYVLVECALSIEVEKLNAGFAS